MARRSTKRRNELISYLKPRYISWALSNLVLVIIVFWTYESVVVEPGQGGRRALFVWPAYWAYVDITDVATAFGILEYDLTGLLGNYLLGITPLFLVINTGVNAILPDGVKRWQPTLARAWRNYILVVLSFTFILSVLGGPHSMVMFISMTTTAAGAFILDSK